MFNRRSFTAALGSILALPFLRKSKGAFSSCGPSCRCSSCSTNISGKGKQDILVSEISESESSWDVEVEQELAEFVMDHGFHQDSEVFSLEKGMFSPQAFVKGRWRDIVCLMEGNSKSYSDETYCYVPLCDTVEGMNDLFRADTCDLKIRIAAQG